MTSCTSEVSREHLDWFPETNDHCHTQVGMDGNGWEVVDWHPPSHLAKCHALITSIMTDLQIYSNSRVGPQTTTMEQLLYIFMNFQMKLSPG